MYKLNQVIWVQCPPFRDLRPTVNCLHTSHILGIIIQDFQECKKSHRESLGSTNNNVIVTFQCLPRSSIFSQQKLTLWLVSCNEDIVVTFTAGSTQAFPLCEDILAAPYALTMWTERTHHTIFCRNSSSSIRTKYTWVFWRLIYTSRQAQSLIKSPT